MITIEELAKRLNVNKSTVSKALNNSHDINQETASEIRALAKELGYEKRPRKSNKEKTIGIITSEIDDAYYSKVINNLISIAESNKYTCCVLTSNFDAISEEKAVRFLVEKNVSGVFLVHSDSSQFKMIRERFKECNIPVVSISEENYESNCDNIWINDLSGVDDAIKHLNLLGHKDIAYIGDRFGMSRLSKYKKAMENNLLTINPNLTILLNERSFDCGYNGAKKIIESGEKFTAIFAQYDDIALGAMRALNENGLIVPQDVSIIGVDNARYCEYLTPSLSSINCNTESLCSVAFKLLSNKINSNDKSVQSVLIKSELIVRESTSIVKSFEN